MKSVLKKVMTGEEFQKLRLKANITQAELAAIMGYSSLSICKMEKEGANIYQAAFIKYIAAHPPTGNDAVEAATLTIDQEVAWDWGRVIAIFEAAIGRCLTENQQQWQQIMELPAASYPMLAQEAAGKMTASLDRELLEILKKHTEWPQMMKRQQLTATARLGYESQKREITQK